MPATETIGSPALWGGFLLFILAMLALDLGVFHRKAHAVSLPEAGGWSLVWVALAALFGLGVWQWVGAQRGLGFFTGYLIEKALSVDNIFVFVVIFASFGVPSESQHRVLFWGVLGALVMRGVMIGIGAELIARYHWILYIFGGFLILTAVKMLLLSTDQKDLSQNLVLRLVRRWFERARRRHARGVSGGPARSP